jgi:hypothetical protein
MDGCPALKLMTERMVFVETGIGKQWGSEKGDIALLRAEKGDIALLPVNKALYPPSFVPVNKALYPPFRCPPFPGF